MKSSIHLPIKKCKIKTINEHHSKISNSFFTPSKTGKNAPARGCRDMLPVSNKFDI